MPASGQRSRPCGCSAESRDAENAEFNGQDWHERRCKFGEPAEQNLHHRLVARERSEDAANHDSEYRQPKQSELRRSDVPNSRSPSADVRIAFAAASALIVALTSPSRAVSASVANPAEGRRARGFGRPFDYARALRPSDGRLTGHRTTEHSKQVMTRFDRVPESASIPSDGIHVWRGRAEARDASWHRRRPASVDPRDRLRAAMASRRSYQDRGAPLLLGGMLTATARAFWPFGGA